MWRLIAAYLLAVAIGGGAMHVWDRAALAGKDIALAKKDVAYVALQRDHEKQRGDTLAKGVELLKGDQAAKAAGEQKGRAVAKSAARDSAARDAHLVKIFREMTDETLRQCLARPVGDELARSLRREGDPPDIHP